MNTPFRASLLASAAVLAASFAKADDLYVASLSTLVYEGTPYASSNNLIGACGGAAQSITVDAGVVFVGDTTGHVYKRAPGGFLTYAYDAPNDAQALAFHNGNLLVGGSDGTIARLDAQSGQVLATLAVGVPVTALAVEGADVWAGSSFGIVEKGHAVNGGFAFWGTCGGPVSSLALDATHLWLGTNQGVIYKLSRATQQVENQFTPNSDCEALAVHLGDVLVGGSDGSIKRLERNLGTIKTSWMQPVSVNALAVVDAGEPGVAYCYGVSCPCGNDDPVGGCQNSSGFGARLTGAGTTSVAADDLAISALSLPANRSARMYMSSLTNNVPFGAGKLCTGGSGYPTFRFGVVNTGPTGTLTLSGVVAYANAHFPLSGHVFAGSTWNFQGWVRDPSGPCGAAFNTTNAYSVTFVP
jgi:hypothetical protein